MNPLERKREANMRSVHLSLAFVSAFALTATVSAAPAGTKSIKAKPPQLHLHHTHGVVVAVAPAAAKGQVEVQVKVHHRHVAKKAKTAAAAAVVKKPKAVSGTRTFHVTQTTHLTRAVHNQGKVSHHAILATEIHKGQHVHVSFNKQHNAHGVEVVVHQHNKKVTAAKKPTVKPKKK